MNIRCWLRWHRWMDMGVRLTYKGHRHEYQCYRCGRFTLEKRHR